jgi:uncharacterized protein
MSKPENPVSRKESLSTYSIVPISTALPVFIGYTEKAAINGKDCFNQLVSIASMEEFETIFGGAPKVQFDLIASDQSLVAKETGSAVNPFSVNVLYNIPFQLIPTTVNYRLYSGLQHFFMNSGGSCFVISIGTYDYSQATLRDPAPFLSALQLLETETDPTLLVIPDAMELKNNQASDLISKYGDCCKVQEAMLQHCGKARNRFAILDVPEGYGEQNSISLNEVTSSFRQGIGHDSLSFGAAYFPWLSTTVFPIDAISSDNIAPSGFTIIRELLTTEFSGQINRETADKINLFTPENTGKPELKNASDYFLQNSASYRFCMDLILQAVNLIPPSSTMAGIYTYVDSERGVWIAPANISLNNVLAPGCPISDTDQGNYLNVPLDGKAICAIRSFTGQGVLIWGARTLDGNSNDWRYINTRRLLIYIEQSIRNGLNQLIFLPNDSGTWSIATVMISDFLTELWQQGGLMGDKASDAFTVQVGLGSTMTSQEILNGEMIVEISVQCNRPAEFLTLTIVVQMETN